MNKFEVNGILLKERDYMEAGIYKFSQNLFLVFVESQPLLDKLIFETIETNMVHWCETSFKVKEICISLKS